jgi:formylmethanofuran dehydrogenase subunit D
MITGEVIVEYDSVSDECYIVSEAFEKLGWKLGDKIVYTIEEDGKVIIENTGQN